MGNSDGLNADTQMHPVKRLIYHPSTHFYQDFQRYDMVLVEVENEGFTINDKVKPVCLSDSAPASDDLCISAGWAKSLSDESFAQYAEYVPVTSEPNCNSTEHYNGLLPKNVFCTGARLIKTDCKNDLGAPLMCKGSDASSPWRLYGLLNHEGECKTVSHPDVFNSIPMLRLW